MASKFRVALDKNLGAFEMMQIGTLEEHPRNPNQHRPEGVKAIGDALAAHGWRKPIVISLRIWEAEGRRVIIKGHGRYRAALERDQKQVPVQLQHYEDAKEELEDMLADNQIASETIVNAGKQAAALERMQSKNLYTGYRKEEVARALARMSQATKERKSKSRKGLATETLQFRACEAKKVRAWLEQHQGNTQSGRILSGLRELTPQIEIPESA